MVSVILPTYNRANLVAESIYSVLNQTYSDLELFVGDDGSDDETEAVVKDIYDKRLHYFKLPHAGSNAFVKNKAIQQAKGEFIAFIDSDDWWPDNKLEKQLPLFYKYPGIGFSITDAINYKNTEILSPRTYNRTSGIECANIFNRMKENRFVVYNPTIVMRRVCLEKTGLFDETMRFGADYHFAMQLAYHYLAGIMYESLLWRRIHDGNESAQVPIENYEAFVHTFEYLYQNNMVSKKYLNKAKCHASFSIGNIHRQKQNIVEARRHYRQALQYNPLQPKCYWSLLKMLNAKR